MNEFDGLIPDQTNQKQRQITSRPVKPVASWAAASNVLIIPPLASLAHQNQQRNIHAGSYLDL
jgi:hypothetical protein